MTAHFSADASHCGTTYYGDPNPIDPIDKTMQALCARGCSPRPTNDGWSARCPAHSDSKPSLSLRRSDDGHALVRCHAGCDVNAVVNALGLTTRDLMMPSHFTAAEFRAPSVMPPRERSGYASAAMAVDALARRMGIPSMEWSYTNADGDEIARVVRWNTEKGKEIRPVALIDGSWQIGSMPSPRTLFRLPSVINAGPHDTIFVCEGEKAAMAGAALGLNTTTSPHGAHAAHKTDWSPMKNRHVVILPDNDEPGEAYASMVMALCKSAGAESVRIVRPRDLWEGLPSHADLADVLGIVGESDVSRTQARDLIIEASLKEDESSSHQDTKTQSQEQTDPVGDSVSLRDTSDTSSELVFEPFPVDTLPLTLRAFVTDTSRSIGCDQSYIALPVLAALASAIGNARQIELKDGWTEPAVLWTAIIGDSGTAKSPAIEAALKAVRARQHDAMGTHARQVEAHQRAVMLYERDLKRWREDGTSGEDPPVEPVLCTSSRCWTDDTTTEAMASLLKDNPRGMLLARDELAGWFSFDRYSGGKGGDVAKWLEMYGARPMIVDRKTGGVIYVPRASVSITGGIQPRVLKRALTEQNRENGLASRLMLAYPPRVCAGWIDGGLSTDIAARLEALFANLYALAPTFDENKAPVPKTLTLDVKAKEACVMWINEHSVRQAELDGDAGYAWSKMRGGFARLALVIHLSRWADGEAVSAHEIDESSVRSATTLAAWFGREAQRVYEIIDDGTDPVQEKLIDWIRRKGGSATVREVTRGSSKFMGRSSEARRALDELVASGLGRWEATEARSGRKSQHFRLGRSAEGR